jgi:hypothetical protein
MLAMILAACSVGYGCGSSDSPSDATGASESVIDTTSSSTPGTVPPATFAALPQGWKHFDDGGALLSKRGGTSAAYATSWDFDPSSGKGPAVDLPDDGVIIQVLLLRRPVGRHSAKGLCRGVLVSKAYPPISGLPLHISDMVRSHLEGAPDVREYRFLGTQDSDYHVDVRVDLAVGADRAAAQRALDGLRLPRWGNQC